MRAFIKRLFNRPMRIVITFTQGTNGHIITAVKVNKKIPFSHAFTSVERLKNDWQARLTNKAQIAGLNSRSPKIREFIKRQTLGDIL